MLAPGRGLRRVAYKDLGHKDSLAPFTIKALIDSKLYGKINIALTVNSAATSRKLYIEQNLAPIDQLTQYCTILWLTPLMDRLFIGPSSDRCRFLDRLVLSIDPNHSKRLRDYEKTLKMRNRLLQEIDIGNKALDSYEAVLADLSIEITQARKYLILMLNKAIEESQYSSHFIKAYASLKGEVEMLLDEYSLEDALVKIQQNLYRERNLTKLTGRCKYGPHRSDFFVEYKAKNMPAYLCSTGEQKSLLINLILSQIELNLQIFNKSTILLLDEADLHLDKANFESFLAILEQLPIQIIMNGTNKINFNKLVNKAQFINLNEYRQL